MEEEEECSYSGFQCSQDEAGALAQVHLLALC